MQLHGVQTFVLEGSQSREPIGDSIDTQGLKLAQFQWSLGMWFLGINPSRDETS
jgi:hypothetical protein